MDKERFSLILLEPNEIYFEDFAVDLLPLQENLAKPASDEGITGRLKLCSKSLVFEPKNWKLPLIKIRYADSDGIYESRDYRLSCKNCLIASCSQYIEMLENNIIEPYKFIREKRTFMFYFHYANVNDSVLQLCQQLHRASSLHASEQNDMIATMVFSLHNRIKFDPLWLENIYEQKIFDCKVDEIHPLVLNPGRLLLTDSLIYFQPYNNIQAYPVIKMKLNCVSSLNKKRFLLRHTGLEIRWDNNEKHIYISFRNLRERDEFCCLVKQQKDVNIPNIEPESMTLKWRNRIISNYDYLLYLNNLADRSFEDLTQYPVFPWIITDYTSPTLDLTNEQIYRDLSKPIGALNLERLKRLKERFEEMDEPKYLYGSHYSAPGFVLFYLFRKYPHLMLCLQNGRFDHPDRMFNKVTDTFNNCLQNMSDFKELIPEFYDTSQNGDFLLNINKINFGARSDGIPVNHVTLPLWAKNSPKIFIQTLRDALESDYVSANLHNWIDLIFGYKQRGEEALKADNVFYHLCYEGSVDLDNIKNSATRHALEVQISEFGQIPKQLFDKPHVSRKTSNCEIESPIRNDKSFVGKTFNLEEKISYSAHKEPITCIHLDGNDIISSGKDGIVKYFTISQKSQMRSISLGSVPLTCIIKIPNSNIFVVGSCDNTISMYNTNYGKITDIIPAHDDTVSCISLVDSYGVLISGSSDCSVKLWRGFNDIGKKAFRLSNAMISYIPFEDKVTHICHRKHKNLLQVIVSTKAGDIFILDLSVDNLSKPILNEYIDEPKLLLSHNTEITGLDLDQTATKLASCSIDRQLLVTDITTGMTLLKSQMEFIPTSLAWCKGIEYLLVVDDHGCLSIWDLVEGKRNFFKEMSKGALTCVKYSPENNYIVTAGKDEMSFKIKCWLFN